MRLGGTQCSLLVSNRIFTCPASLHELSHAICHLLYLLEVFGIAAACSFNAGGQELGRQVHPNMKPDPNISTIPGSKRATLMQ